MTLDTLLNPQIRLFIGVTAFIMIAIAFNLIAANHQQRSSQLKKWASDQGFNFFNSFEIDWSWKRNCGVMKEQKVQSWLDQHGHLRKNLNIHKSSLTFFNKGFERVAYDLLNKNSTWIFKYNYNFFVGKNSFLREQTVYYINNFEFNIPHFIFQPNNLSYQLDETFTEHKLQYKHNEMASEHHLLLTNQFRESIDFLNSKFIEILDNYEDLYIEAKNNEICIVFQNQLAESEDLQAIVEDCQELISNLIPIQNEQKYIA